MVSLKLIGQAASLKSATGLDAIVLSLKLSKGQVTRLEIQAGFLGYSLEVINWLDKAHVISLKSTGVISTKYLPRKFRWTFDQTIGHHSLAKLSHKISLSYIVYIIFFKSDLFSASPNKFNLHENRGWCLLLYLSFPTAQSSSWELSICWFNEWTYIGLLRNV